MRFPEVPGDTLRERFTNLVRHVISLPKTTVEEKQKSKRRKNAKGALALTVLLVLSIGAFVSMLFMAFQVFAQNTPRGKTWYDGGSEFGGYITLKSGCPKSDESPAETYKEIQSNTGEEPQLTDQGDEVLIKAADGEVYHYFRTKKACEEYVSQVRKENQEQEKQQRDFHNKYN